MVTYSYTPVANDVISEMYGTGSQLSALLDRLMSSTENDFQNWSGAAKSAFSGVKKDWEQMAGRMQANLNTAAQALDSIMNTYGNAEKNAVNLWS